VTFNSFVTDSSPSKGDAVVLNCSVRSYGNKKPNVTVELTDSHGLRLISDNHSPLNVSTMVRYSVNVTSSVSGPFHCTVTAAVVAMETVSKTLSVTLDELGELRTYYLATSFSSRTSRKSKTEVYFKNFTFNSLLTAYNSINRLLYESFARIKKYHFKRSDFISV